MPQETTVHAAAAPRLLRQLTELGLPGREMMLAAGLEEIHLRGEIRAPRAPFLAVKALASQRLEDPCIGFRLGSTTRVEDFDIFGAAVVHARNLDELTALVARYFAVWEEGAAIHVLSSAEMIRVVYENEPRGSLADIIDSQQTIIFIASTCARFFDNRHSFLIGCSCPMPRHPACARAATVPQCRILYNQRDWYVDVPRRAFEENLPGGHPAALRILHRDLEAQLEQLRSEKDFLTSLRHCIRHGLPRGFGLPEIATAMRVSPRTLQMRLRECGTSYSMQLKEIRLRMAKELLDDGHSTLEHIATQVGFASVPAFSRFFSEQTGMSPAAFRAQEQK